MNETQRKFLEANSFTAYGTGMLVVEFTDACLACDMLPSAGERPQLADTKQSRFCQGYEIPWSDEFILRVRRKHREQPIWHDNNVIVQAMLQCLAALALTPAAPPPDAAGGTPRHCCTYSDGLTPVCASFFSEVSYSCANCGHHKDCHKPTAQSPQEPPRFTDDETDVLIAWLQMYIRPNSVNRSDIGLRDETIKVIRDYQRLAAAERQPDTLPFQAGAR